jgi:hypothetical protein
LDVSRIAQAEAFDGVDHSPAAEEDAREAE